MLKSVVVAVAMSLLPAAGLAATLGPYTDLVVFGDSLSDPGNVDFLSGGVVPDPDFYPNGQFTNGDTWATKLGADFASRTNFAFGGARASTNDDDIIPDFAAQIALFNATKSTLGLGSRPLGAVWFGGNDVLNAFSSSNPTEVLTQAVVDLARGIQTLRASGLPEILVFGLPDLGRIPEVTQAGDFAIRNASAGSIAFNDFLKFSISGLFGDGSVRYFDTLSLFDTVIAGGPALGFDNVTDACLLTEVDPLVCRGDAGYLFHDTLHPTDRAHTLIAEAVRATVVPLPAGGLLLLTALGGIALLRRRAA